MITGTVKCFDADKGYGYLSSDNGGEDTFVHFTEIKTEGIKSLNVGQKVTFELEPDPRNSRFRATHVSVI